MSERVFGINDFDAIRENIQRINQEEKGVINTSDESSQSESNGTAAGFDFQMRFDGNSGKLIVWAVSGAAQDRAVDWTQHIDGSYRKLSRSMEQKLIREGFKIKYI